ncbi:MAG: universal stress protein [Gammaproteobacteria bacterium]|nr:universal stress protein [Gammaproteobacteria bacterium]
MTQDKTRLFVIVDPTASHQVALVKALLIAKLADCEIHAFLCVYQDISKGDAYDSRHDFKHSTLAEAKQWLDEQLEPCKVAGLSFSKEVVWNQRWVDAAMHSIAKSGCDLVIKSSFHHSKSRRFYRATSDFKLMRYCACPILFAHQTQEWQSNKVLACVDLESTDSKHARLNGVIARDARAIADIVGMDLYIAAAHKGDIDVDNLPIKGQGHQLDMRQLGELYGVDESRIFLRRGDTIATLKGVCDELDPSIVIMGTLARTGIKGKLIGNTAEKLLDLIDADVLTVN